MANCDHLVISNSTYSWWGSFLSKSKITVGPKKWFTNQEGSDIMLDEWIQI